MWKKRKVPNLAQKSKLWSKIKTLVKKGKSGQKTKMCSNIENMVQNFQTIFNKKKIVKNRNFSQKLKNYSNVQKFCKILEHKIVRKNTKKKIQKFHEKHVLSNTVWLTISEKKLQLPAITIHFKFWFIFYVKHVLNQILKIKLNN